MLYDINMEVDNKENIYLKDQIKNIIIDSSPKKISNVTIYKRINKMIALGELSRVGNGQYVFVNKAKFDYKIGLNNSLSVVNKLNEKLDKSAKYVIYETTLLNMFLNHLIGWPTLIVEVEKDLVDSVFWFLKDEGVNNVLLNPTENENYMYNPYDGSGVIVKKMVSKSPIDNKNHKIKIEKILVDIVCDKTLNMFYEGAEIPHMVEDILDKYTVKYDTVKNYAKRRHYYDRFIKYVPEKLKGVFRD